MKSLNALLHQVVDYAGLFPPAALSLEETVRNYLDYQNHRRFWMLGRLIIPAAKLKAYAEFCDTAKIDAEGWRISALVPSINAPDEAFDNAIKSIQEFNSDDKLGQVDVVEGKIDSAHEIDGTAEALPDKIHMFLEVDWRDPASLIESLGQQNRPNLFAKIRTGSVNADEIPSPDHVAKFIRCAAQHNVGFKATAGLHHPVRNEYALTYEERPPRATMHGFANVFLASAFAFGQGWNETQIAELLTDSDPNSFQFADDQVGWRDHMIDIDQISESRRRFAKSFGSCSFEEPITDLQEIGWLATTANTI